MIAGELSAFCDSKLCNCVCCPMIAGELSAFCERVLDDQGMEFEEEVAHRASSHSASSALRKQ